MLALLPLVLMVGGGEQSVASLLFYHQSVTGRSHLPRQQGVIARGDDEDQRQF